MTAPAQPQTQPQVYEGIAVSGGVALGPLHVLRGPGATARRAGDPVQEAAAFKAALNEAATALQALIEAEDSLAGDILEFQLALLEDDDITAPVLAAIAGGTPADRAWIDKMDAEIADYRGDGDGVLAGRAEDLSDLKNRVLSALTGSSAALAEVPAGAILVAEDLTPSLFLDIDWSRLAGAVTTGGSPTSHVAILARARGVSLVVGTRLAVEGLPAGGTAILDAAAGRLTVNPDSAARAAAEAAGAAEAEKERAIAAVLHQPARTADGIPVMVLANIDAPALLDQVSSDICDGVGLTRTEFLFAGGRQPDEEEQLAFYRRLLAWADGRPVTVRTLDAGGDKPLPGVTIDGETNPFLGVRGLRLSFARPEVFRCQLRALVRAAEEAGNLKVMLPMITAPWELDQARAMLDEEIAGLRQAGIPCAHPALGIMIEVPAAALMAGDFEADFYSIGSNDLIQYTAACARDNPAVAALADPRTPAVLELIRRVVAAGEARGVEVSLCGEMASSPALISSLLDCGLTMLSCAPAQIGPVKLAIADYDGRGRNGADHG
ncbi:phosphoenolpyruvate--protein phosphotransferase [Pelagibius marinus]|uniref:phosphoenolpyruvate--protein phosphotransferase n=1 Tax=Pelagibius marinus TaxID=2762760 RepID=UPI00187265A4|nr:phosphoenolpyruvate--protein phosphotransferase [Pelagibius marinus]